MSKTYHFAMVPDKKGGLGTLLKAGLLIGTAYLAYKNLSGKDGDTKGDSGAGTSVIGAGVDKAAKEAGDFAAKVLKAAKKVVE